MGLTDRLKGGLKAGIPRRDERFAAKELNCPMGDIVDLSASGMRLRRKGKPPVREGQTERFTLGGSTQKVTVSGRVVWLKRASLVANVFEMGVQFVGLTPGQSAALVQLARYGFVGAGKHQHAAPLQEDPAPECAPNAAGAPDAGAQAEAPNWTAGAGARPSVSASVEVDDLYTIFELPRGASQEQIHARYRRLALRLHPDSGGQGADERRFVELSKAYKILGDDEVRARYDTMLGKAKPAA